MIFRFLLVLNDYFCLCINVVLFVRCLCPLTICVSPCVLCILWQFSILSAVAMGSTRTLSADFYLPTVLFASWPACNWATLHDPHSRISGNWVSKIFFHNFRHLHYIWVVRYQAYLLMQLRHNKNALTLKCQTCKKIKTTIRV